MRLQRQHLWRRAGATIALAGVLAAGVLGSVRGVAAQNATPTSGSPSSGLATVSVSGHGEVSVPPDTASFTVGVDVIKPTLDEAQREATAQATAVIDAVKAAGISDKDIQTTNFSVNILRDNSQNGDPTKITGYEVTNQVQVTVRDTSTLGDLLGAAVQAGANNVYGVSFFVEDQTRAASEARVKAVADARQKAEELAAAAGLSLGPVVTISEGVPSSPVPVFAMARAAESAAPAPPPIQTGSTIIAVDVQMTFELR